MAKVLKRVLALSRGTKSSYEESYCVDDQIISGSDLKPWIKLICVEMVQVTCSRWVCSKRWDKGDCNHLWRGIEKKWHMKILKTQVVKMLIFSWSWVYMPYYQGRCNTNYWQVSSAQTNQTQVLTWEKHNDNTFTCWFWGLFFVGLEIPRNKLSEKSKITENEVRSKKLWLFPYGDMCCPEDPRSFRPFMRRL